jgi:hypothetical protein
MFCGSNCKGPEKLVGTLNSQNIQVLLSGLEVIDPVGKFQKFLKSFFNQNVTFKNFLPSQSKPSSSFLKSENHV